MDTVQEVKQPTRPYRILRLSLLCIALLAVGFLAGFFTAQFFPGWDSGGTILSSLQSTLQSQAETITASLPSYSAEAKDAQKALAALARQKGSRQRAKHLELLVLVNPWHTLPEDSDPELAPVVSHWQPTSEFEVDARCADELEAMLNACLSEGFIAEVCSAYRTQEYQQMLFDNKILRLTEEGVSPEEAPTVAATTVALPGTSEHQLGLAVDILDISYPYLDEYQMFTGAQQWLMEHCWEYGFILRYPDGTSDITGIIFEPWHYRYVGREHAAAIHELGITLEEYIDLRAGR